ncbi:MAG: cyclic pyranopterin monophosphate synthase MoaC [Planctomycetota bacterium]|jgi:cyclic pyranopterin phosphate synthase|nr:cyclic pyranopterin monophosphate synthase MoaC [Planctomycetota bacterium]
MKSLSHLDDTGEAHMVDVSSKPETERVAVAEGRVRLSPEVFALISKRSLPKGDLGPVARLAGIAGAKWTGHLIPLCHPIRLTDIDVQMVLDECDHSVIIRATTRTVERTGVEMEAMTAVSVACLTVYDMVKAVGRETRIESISLLSKSGGQSGDWSRT